MCPPVLRFWVEILAPGNLTRHLAGRAARAQAGLAGREGRRTHTWHGTRIRSTEQEPAHKAGPEKMDGFGTAALLMHDGPLEGLMLTL